MPNRMRPPPPAANAEPAKARETYLVVLRALPGIDGIRALRGALKALLRRHGLQCIKASPDPSDQEILAAGRRAGQDKANKGADDAGPG